MVRALIVLIPILCASCAPPSGEAGSRAGISWEPQARAVAAGRDGQIMIWASESPSLLVAAPGEKPGSADLVYAGSKDEGGTFGHPLRVNPLPGEVSAHGENGPQLRLLRGTSILAAWEGRGDIRFARCVDFGRSFLPAVTVNDDGGESYQSFFCMETGPDGSLYVAWIDFRDTKTDPPGTASIYLARSDDQGATFGKNVKVAGGVCPCCRPAIAVEAGGAVHLAWRHVLDGNARDVVLAGSRDKGQSWSAPVRVATDEWKLDGCPHSGPTMAALPTGLFLAWYTGARNRASLQLSRSSDGKTFEPPRAVESSLHDSNHPHLIGVEGEPWIIFQARTPDQGGGWGAPKAAVVRCDSAGRPGAPMILPSLGGSVTYPRLAAGNAGRLYATWTEAGPQGTSVVLCRGRREAP